MDTKQRQMKWRVCRSICRYELVFSFPSHRDELDVLLVTGSFMPLGNNPLSFLRLLQLASGKDRIKTIFEKLYVLKLRYSSQWKSDRSRNKTLDTNTFNYREYLSLKRDDFFIFKFAEKPDFFICKRDSRYFTPNFGFQILEFWHHET